MFVDTAGVSEVLPFGSKVLQARLCQTPVPASQLFFKGENGFNMAPVSYTHLAMAYDVPVLISRQSGVAEVVRNAIKVDFWDIREMANKICAILSYPFLAAEEVRNCREELKAIRWENVADRLNAIYAQLVSGGK